MVLSQDGIFSRAEQGADKYGQAKARETLEILLGEAQMRKYESGLTPSELDEEIAKVGSLLPKEDENSNNQLVIVEGYIFKVDKSVPKIIDYVGPADGIIITASVKQSGDWKNPVATVTGTITKYGGGTVTSSTATATEGVTITGFPTAGGSYTIQNITTDTDITITAKDSEGHAPVTEVIKVRLVRDNIPPIISNAKAEADNELKIKISVKAVDNESGLQKINYNVTPNTITPASGEITSGEEIELTATEENEYTITFTATDNAKNSSTTEVKATALDGGVIKHIKTLEGLKEVNTKIIYGADVLGYDCTRTGVEWQIFYIDEEDDHRVYLISKDFMAPPTNNSTTKLIKGGNTNYKKAYKFGEDTYDQSILGSFSGSLPATTEAAPLGKFMSDYLNDYAGASASSSVPNIQATKLMLDQNMWAEYKGAKADLAFGGPTLPLFAASYNDIAKTATKLGIQKSGTGYQVKIGGGSWSTKISGYGDTDTQKGIYFKENNKKSAYGTWLASPSSEHDTYVMLADCDGTVGTIYYDEGGLGFRPVVSLKFDVIFTDNGNGTYTIN